MKREVVVDRDQILGKEDDIQSWLDFYNTTLDFWHLDPKHIVFYFPNRVVAVLFKLRWS